MNAGPSLSRAFALCAIGISVAGCGRAASSGAAGAPGPATVMAAAAAARPAAAAMPAGVSAATVSLGDSLFNANACARCHGRAGVGGQNGPPLAKGDSAKWLHSSGSYDEIVATIIAGVPREKMVDQSRRFQMNPRGSNPPLTDDQIKAVAAYIWKLNHP